MIVAAWVCLFSPLAAAVAITLGGTRLSRRAAGYVATFSVAISFVAAAVDFFSLLGTQAEEKTHLSIGWTWLSAGNFHAELSVLVDPLSVLMMLIVSGVGMLIVGYSIGYMDGEDEERRYFAYMALFVFSMLLLVQGGNLLLLLVGWGLVGLSSYLLIGFHHERPSAVAAAKKAFIMNAVGDATMALAFFLLIQRTHSLSFGSAEEFAIFHVNSWEINLIALGLLGGAVAKSAQLPLHTWLPDAMEGPTPVSALIHAATMVTAGVYLLVRTELIFHEAPHVQQLAAGLGAATLLVAGVIAVVQVDIKRVIAYSTMSQIGYMFLGAGIGAYANSLFHLMTHAFFKALLFLAAGIVIHALVGEQDMRKMGGLRRFLPRTYVAFLIGGLALTGIPPLSGFFSKDSILASALAQGTYGQILFAAGLLGAFLTGLYTFRMVFLVFGGEPSPYAREHLHRPDRSEPWLWMSLTVAALSVLAVIGGWIQIAGVWHPFADFLQPAVGPPEFFREPTGTQDFLTALASIAVAIIGIALAWAIYSARRLTIPRWRPARTVLEHKFYFDELYDVLFYRPTVRLARALRDFVEGPLILGSITGIAVGARRIAGEVTALQTGLVRTYALAIAGGVTVMALVFVWVK
jgi:NADH-quinone oxidoreductase subunit L